MRKLILGIAISFSLTFGLSAQDSHSDHNHDQGSHAQESTEVSHDGESHDEKNHSDTHDGHDAHGHDGQHECGCGHHEEGVFDVTATAYHHIGDANAFHVFGDLYFPLPCIVYENESGALDFFMSSKLSKETPI